MNDIPPVSVSPHRPSAAAPLRADPVPVFRELAPQSSRAEPANLEALHDVEVSVRIELGRARMRIEDVLRLEEGSVVQLDRRADDPVDVYVNDRLVARGEVVVLNDKFAVRLMEVVSPIKDD
jgi:flagellar motor switch protein FliN/FliY